jgi:ABC-2 type transport system ATP-binding protein
MAIIETEKLTKYYGKVRGIESLDLCVKQGEVFGFLGPNGAGKTTTIRLLLDLIRPTSGKASVFGLDANTHSLAIRQRIGYVPGDVVLYDGLTGNEFLKLMGSFHGGYSASRVKELLDRLELDPSRQSRAYSKGNKQKLAVVQAFASDPELLILDEPTSGLDPLIQKRFYDMVLEEKKSGKTIFFSSHILPEAERICDRVGIVKEGSLVAVESVEDLKHKKVRHMEIHFSRNVDASELAMPGVEITSLAEKHAELRISSNISSLLQKLAGLPVEDMSFPEANLEDSFMAFYGGGK